MWLFFFEISYLGQAEGWSAAFEITKLVVWSVTSTEGDQQVFAVQVSDG